MKISTILVGLMAFMIVPLWAQESDQERVPPATSRCAGSDQPTEFDSDRMSTPPPVSGLTLPTVLGSQERRNYLRGGVGLLTAHTDNALGDAGGKPDGDTSYSVAPFLSIDQTTTREQLILSYAPGYTFYQRFSNLDMTDQNASIRFAYRLSPHVTFSASDVFQKTSNELNQPYVPVTGSLASGPGAPNFSVLAPTASQLNNAGNVGLAYQYALNDMIGADGTFTNLHYPNPSQVAGLFDSSSQAGLAFWAHRISRRHYFGVLYQYQRLLAYPTQGVTETQTQAPLGFYSFYPTKNVTLSMFGGPQYADTVQPSQAELKQWTPAGGASLRWQALRTSLAVGYTHIVSSSAGLIGAVHFDSATATITQQLTKTLTASVSGGYAQNEILGRFNSSFGELDGHSIIGSASLQQQIGKSVSVQLGYTRLRQDYGGVPVLALTPNTNRESILISYHFDKALGR